MILSINTKGGAGKSTTSMQLLAPWKLSNNEKAVVVELDDQNQDSEDYSSSVVEAYQHRVGKEARIHASFEKLIQGYMNKDPILDIGGNKTSDLTLQTLGATGAFLMIDLIVIPISSTGTDVKNARKTIELIKKHMPKYEGPIAMVITRAESDDIDDLKFDYPDAFELVAEFDLKGPLVLPRITAFANSRTVGRTVWEVAQNADKLNQESQKRMMQAIKNNDSKGTAYSTRINTLISESVEALPHLEKAFKQLDEITSKNKPKTDKAEKEKASE